ncbi:MAG: protein rep [Pseudomonadota bacterium]
MTLIDTQAEFHSDPADTARQYRHKLRREAARLCPGERVNSCGVKRTGEMVELWRDSAGGAFWKGLETCGSVWMCPTCSAKIASRRADEVRELVKAHEARGRAVYMATFTIQHSAFDAAADTRALVTKAWTRMQAGKGWKGFKAFFDVMGTVRALEVTFGKNGWHPHLHVLLFTDQPLRRHTQLRMKQRLFDRWSQIVERLGGYSDVHAFHLRRASNGTVAAEYVAKWGAGHEIAKGPMKDAAGCSVWDLLKRSDNGDHLAGIHFQRYAEAFKGARHLTYSRGLRERYDLRHPQEDLDLALDGEEGGERVDPETGEVMNTEAGCLYTVDSVRWAFVLKLKATGLLLDIARDEGREGVERWFDSHHASSPHRPEDFAPKRPRKERRIYREAADRATGSRTGAELAADMKRAARAADEADAMKELVRRDASVIFGAFKKKGGDVD